MGEALCLQCLVGHSVVQGGVFFWCTTEVADMKVYLEVHCFHCFCPCYIYSEFPHFYYKGKETVTFDRGRDKHVRK
jgi:hypothetical protein